MIENRVVCTKENDVSGRAAKKHASGRAAKNK